LSFEARKEEMIERAPNRDDRPHQPVEGGKEKYVTDAPELKARPEKSEVFSPGKEF
jgi:hypothetical protein